MATWIFRVTTSNPISLTSFPKLWAMGLRPAVEVLPDVQAYCCTKMSAKIGSAASLWGFDVLSEEWDEFV